MFNRTRNLLQLLPPLKWWVFLQYYHDDNSIAVIETRGDDYVRDKIKKICSLYMCEINDNKRGITIDRWQRFGAVIRYTFTQDEYKYIIEIV